MKAIQLNPMHIKAYYNLGIALYAEGRNMEAISNYKIAIKLRPGFAYAHYNLGLVLLQEKKMNEAIYHFSETVRLRPDLAPARRYLELLTTKVSELTIKLHLLDIKKGFDFCLKGFFKYADKWYQSIF